MLTLEVIHTLFDTYLDRMLAKFEPKRIVQNVQNVCFFDKKNRIFKQLLTKRWRHFAKLFCSWTNCLMVNYEFSDYYLSGFQNYGNLTRVTSLKFAPNMSNMANPTSMKHPVSIPKFPSRHSLTHNYVTHIIVVIWQLNKSLWLDCFI